MGRMDRLTGDFKGASMFATVDQARQYNRLREYELTGLTPDEIMEIQRHRENNQTCYVSEAAESERMRIEIAALRAELAGYKALLSSVHELADAEKFEAVTDMIDTVLPTIGRAALEGGQQ